MTMLDVLGLCLCDLPHPAPHDYKIAAITLSISSFKISSKDNKQGGRNVSPASLVYQKMVFPRGLASNLQARRESSEHH